MASRSNISNKSINSTKNPVSSRLRSQSESAASISKNKHTTPSKNEKAANQSMKPSPNLSDTPSSSRVCDVCKGIEDFRSLKLNEVIAEFESKIEELTNSLNNNSSMLNHALDTIKHFILHTEPCETNNFFSKTYDKISAVSSDIHDLSNYVTKLDTIEELVNKMIDNVLSNSLPASEPHSCKRLENLELICGELTRKMDNFNFKPLNPTLTIDTEPKIPRTVTPPQPHPNPKACIVLGDSNTKHISLSRNTLESHRVPTYLIEDIDPHQCIGYKKIWIHVGTNNIKTINCKDMDDVKKHFNTLISKLDIIRNLCPHSKILVSPILPTAIPALNHRALLFNKLLFSKPNWFTTLDFNLFCGADGNLMTIYRCYNNPRDKIHLGSLGIQILTSKAKHCLSLLDNRSYASAVRQY